MIVRFSFILGSLSFGQPGDWKYVNGEVGLDSEIPNQLSKQEEELGWELMFDGEQLSSPWRGYRDSLIPAGWTVQEGSLTRLAGGGDLLYSQEYTNFIWSIEWKVSHGANSGLFYRGNESTSKMYLNAIEMQVVDNDNHVDGQHPEHQAGAAYDMFEVHHDGLVGYDPSYRDSGEPAGYNKVLVVVYGDHHEFWLNGIKVVEFDYGNEEWWQRKSNSKFSKVKQYGEAKSGYLGLQDHTNQVWFRNVKVRPLSVDPTEEEIWPFRKSISPVVLQKKEMKDWYTNGVNALFVNGKGTDRVQRYLLNGKAVYFSKKQKVGRMLSLKY